MWDAEGGLGDADAEGEDDPAYADGVYKKANDSGVEIFVPVGIRNEEGMIEPLPVEDGRDREPTQVGRTHAMNVDNTSEEALFGGLSEYVPPRAGELVCSSFQSYIFLHKSDYSIECKRYTCDGTVTNPTHRDYSRDQFRRSQLFNFTHLPQCTQNRC